MENIAAFLQRPPGVIRRAGWLFLYQPIIQRPGQPPIPAKWLRKWGVLRDGMQLFYDEEQKEQPKNKKSATTSTSELPTHWIQVVDAAMNPRDPAVIPEKPFTWRLTEKGGKKNLVMGCVDINIAKDDKTAWLEASRGQSRSIFWNTEHVCLADFEEMVQTILPGPKKTFEEGKQYPWRVKWWLGEPYFVPGQKSAREKPQALDIWVKAEAGRQRWQAVSHCLDDLNTYSKMWQEDEVSLHPANIDIQDWVQGVEDQVRLNAELITSTGDVLGKLAAAEGNPLQLSLGFKDKAVMRKHTHLGWSSKMHKWVVPGPFFDMLLAAVAVEAEFHDRMKLLAKQVEAEYIRADFKPLHRIIDKTQLCYANNFARNLDIVRGSWVFDDIGTIPRALYELQQSTGISILQVKNWLNPGYDADINGGYRGMCIRLTVGRHHHICELQIHLRKFLAVKDEFGKGGHDRYVLFRNEKCI